MISLPKSIEDIPMIVHYENSCILLSIGRYAFAFGIARYTGYVVFFELAWVAFINYTNSNNFHK